MVLRRRRLLLAGLLISLFFILYHLPRTGLGQPNRPTSPWLRALRGDKDAFQIHLDDSFAGLIPSDGREIYPVQIPIELPEASLGHTLPRVQHDFSTSASAGPQKERLKAVEEAFQYSWNGYKQYAWAKDELMPVTGFHRASFGDWAATLVDSLDTLWIMDRKDEFEQGVEAVRSIDFSSPDNLPINVFEVTIRYLGGLLGAYDISGHQYPILLEKAKEVGTMLMGAFDTYNRMPVTYWNKLYGEKASTSASIAEFGSLSLEFTRLSQLTKDMKYFDAIARITECMVSQQPHSRLPGLFPHTVNARDCKFTTDSTFSLGAFADSAYEYLPKMHQLLNGSAVAYQDMYLAALDPIFSHVLQRPMTPQNLDILLAATHKAYQPTPETISQMQHLSCFAGGMYALGSRLFSRPSDMSIARRLTEGCIWAYNSTPTGIMPEQFYFVPCAPSGASSSSATGSSNAACPWNQSLYEDHLWSDHHHHVRRPPASLDLHLSLSDQKALAVNSTTCPLGMTAISSPTYRLRPEAIESVFILYRTTGDPWLRDAAWDMFRAITAQTRTTFGFSSIEDVTVPVPVGLGSDSASDSDSKSKKPAHRKTDRQETFWTAETLKYFWLIFADEGQVSLDEWVLNTEAHPFRLQQPAEPK